MPADPPLSRLQDDAVHHHLSAIGRMFEVVGLGRQPLWVGAVSPDGFVDDGGRRRLRRLEVMLAGRAGVSLPNVDAMPRTMAESCPNALRHRVGVVAADTAKRESVRSGKNPAEIEVGQEAGILREFESEESRPRKGKGKIPPTPRNFALDGLFGPHLAGDKEKPWIAPTCSRRTAFP